MAEIWETICKKTLYDLHAIEAAVESLPEEIAMEREKMTSIKSAMSSSTPVKGGGSQYEDRINNCLTKIDLFTDNLKCAQKEVDITYRALGGLNDEEMHLLDVLYISRQKHAVSRLCDDLQCDERTIWRRASNALKKYCILRYGRL